MQDSLIISTNFKKTINYIDKILINYPHEERILRDKINLTCYNILEGIYRANVYKEINYMKEIIVQIRMLEYYIKISLDKELINFKKYENIGKYLLDIIKMVNGWINFEKNK